MVIDMGALRFPSRKFLASLICVALCSAPVFADLGEFRDKAVESEQNKDSKPAAPGDDTSNNLDPELVQALLMLWVYLNVSVTYDDYPYAHEKYIQYDFGGKDSRGWKFWRGSVGENVIAGDGEVGYQSVFEANIFPFLGPRVSVTRWIDGSDELRILEIGGQLSVFQTRFIAMSVYVQWAAMQELMSRSGGSFGVELRSWATRPVSFAFSFGGQSYDSGLELGSIDARIGFHINRWEIDAGYQSLTIADSRPDAAFLGGPYLGARVNF